MYQTMKKSNWQIKDIIDLEYFIRHDEKSVGDADQNALSKSDRGIYLNHIQPYESNGKSISKGQTLKIWLDERRQSESFENEKKTILPGALFEEIYHFLKYSFLALGLILGLGLAFTFLYYRGDRPLNVSTFFGAFVIVQNILLLFLIVFSLMRIFSHKPPYSSIIAKSLSELITKLIVTIKERGLSKLSGSTRGRFEAGFGIFQEKGKSYGSLFLWTSFVLTQGFMAAFNVGVVCALLIKIMGSDIAFGWQSTLKISAEWISELVQVISSPWSWFIPQEIAYPTLSQIQGSHMILKDGIHLMTTEDMTSWWPFLCLAILFYGLMPRLILIAAGFLGRKNAINRFDFSQSVFEGLWRRLQTPIVSTAGKFVDEGIPDKNHNAADSENSESVPQYQTIPEQQDSYVLLIPDDIMESYPSDDLQYSASKNTKNSIIKRLTTGEDDEQDLRLIEDIIKKSKDNRALNIFLIKEAWQPPIREDLRFIEKLRETLGPKSNIKVGLMGKPKEGRGSTVIKEEEWMAWDQKLKALGDPYLSLERLGAI